MATAELKRVLDESGAQYELLPHAHTESALDEAKALGVRPDEVAKTLVLRNDAGYVRAVIPASERIDIRKIAEVLGESRKHVQLASEEELARDYSEFELGAVPPIGGKDDPVVIDRRVAEEDSVVLEAGNHDESIRLRTEDLIRITNARLADICADNGR